MATRGQVLAVNLGSARAEGRVMVINVLRLLPRRHTSTVSYPATGRQVTLTWWQTGDRVFRVREV